MRQNQGYDPNAFYYNQQKNHQQADCTYSPAERNVQQQCFPSFPPGGSTTGPTGPQGPISYTKLKKPQPQ